MDLEVMHRLFGAFILHKVSEGICNAAVNSAQE